MNFNGLGIVSAVLAIAAFAVAYRWMKGRQSKARVLWFLLAAGLSLPGLSFAAYYLHVLPESGWYYEFRSLTATELLLVFVGVAGGMAAAVLPRVLLVLPLSGVIVLVSVPFCKPVLWPLSEGVLKDKWDGEMCLQSTPSTCGAASLATILRHHGVAVTEAELADEAYSYAGGTEAWYLARSARTRGCEVRFDVVRGGFRPESGLPAMVGVRFGATGHFIAVLGQEGDRYIVGEPLSGRKLLTRDELEERYTFTGFQMVVLQES